MDYFLFFTIAFVTTLLLVPPVKHLAAVAGVMDEPCERKVHGRSVPRLGGLAIFFGFLLAYAVFFQGETSFRGIFLGMCIIVVIGILDDSFGLEPKMKLLGQVVAAISAMALSGVNVASFTNIFGIDYSLGILSWPLTLMWIVGVTNAINLSDGLDGLASGISLIAFTSFGILAWQREDWFILSLCIVLVGNILGFLKYNTHPAEIFMGDTGSLFLGYSLATISLAGNFKSLTTMTLLVTVLVLLVPISDTAWAIIRRLREGRSPFSADKSHFHHELLKAGMNQNQTVSIIYAISVALSIIAVALANNSNLKLVMVPIIVMGLGLGVCHLLGVVDLSGPALRWSQKFESLFSNRIQSALSKLAMYFVNLGVFYYILVFSLGLPFVSSNLLLVATTIMMIVLYLVITKGANGQSFLIFSLFFLCAIMVMVTEQLGQVGGQLFGVISFSIVEECAFWCLVFGVFGKVFFKKRKEIILSTPLELFILLVVISVTMVPPELKVQLGLVRLVFRTFVLFLGFKILVLSGFTYRQKTLATSIATVFFVLFGVFL